jgi:hypothetical protein
MRLSERQNLDQRDIRRQPPAKHLSHAACAPSRQDEVVVRRPKIIRVPLNAQAGTLAPASGCPRRRGSRQQEVAVLRGDGTVTLRR